MHLKRVIFFILLLITTGNLFSQSADFIADTLVGCDTLTVSFTDQSVGATSWQWDFNNDGTTDSNEQNPTYTFSTPGIYTVRLTINNSTFEQKANYITIIPEPDPTFWHQDTLGLSSYNIVFRNRVQPLERNVDYIRSWNFGDGTSGYGRTILHQFPDTGRYVVNLEVYSSQIPQCRASAAQRLIVNNSIVIPNVFSPNNDSKNDLFIVKYNGINHLHFYVYSRYGNLVFKSSAPVIFWDGTNLSGQNASAGVYYYSLTSDDGAINESGFLHLFR